VLAKDFTRAVQEARTGRYDELASEMKDAAGVGQQSSHSIYRMARRRRMRRMDLKNTFICPSEEFSVGMWGGVPIAMFLDQKNSSHAILLGFPPVHAS